GGAVHCIIPRVLARQWVLSFPIPLRVLFAAHPDLFTPVLQILHRVIFGFLIKQGAQAQLSRYRYRHADTALRRGRQS
ncbi:MAG: hypothetical protein ACREX9_00755, partial [Gammaproteobacteria bacterium]